MDQRRRPAEDKALAAKLGAVEMVRRGCVACYDLFAEFPGPTAEGLTAVAGAYAEVGMRAVVAPLMADRTFWRAIPGLFGALPPELQAALDRIVLAPRDTSLDACREAVRRWPFDRRRQRLALAPTIPHHCDDASSSACRDLAREAGLGIQTHVGESKLQAVVGVAKYGRTLTAHLDALGVIGPEFTAAHAVWLDDDDMRRLADRGASVAHNPSSNLRLGAGVAAARAFRERGINVGLGTDACTCSDHLNMLRSCASPPGSRACRAWTRRRGSAPATSSRWRRSAARAPSAWVTASPSLRRAPRRTSSSSTSTSRRGSP